MGDHGEDKRFCQQSEGSQVEEQWIFFLQKAELEAFLGNTWRSNLVHYLFYVFNIQWWRGTECWLGIKD